MKKLFLLILVAVSMVTAAMAQNREITATIIDGDTKEPAINATARLLKSDSTFITGTITDANGTFSIKAPNDGDFVIKISSVGFDPIVKAVSIHQGKNVNLGKIKMNPSSVMLEQATVKAYGSKVSVKKDTFIYNVDAYRTAEGSVIEELVKKLPGAEVDDDGKITINGKEVTKILVDGKEFMTGDTKTAMKNLPTSIVNRVKAYDQQSDMARITGIEDGNEETVLDFGIKPGMNKGMFTNLDLGLGTENRYSWRGMGAYFANRSRIMVMTNANNVSDRGFGGGGGRFRMGNNGLNATKMVGLNYNFEEKNKLKIDGSIRWNHSDGDILSQQSVERFVVKKGAFSNSNTQQYSRGDSWNFQGRLEWQPDEMTNIMFRPTASISANDGSSRGLSAMFDEDPYLHVFDPLASADISKLVSDTLVVNYQTDGNLNYSNNTRYNGTLQFNRKLNNEGRNITLSGSGGYTDTENKTITTSDIIYYQIKLASGEDSTYFTNKYNLTPSNNWNASVQLSYSEPIAKRTYLQFSYQYRYQYSESDRSTYDYSKNLFDANPFLGVRNEYREWNNYLSRINNPLSDAYFNQSQSRYSEYKNYIHDINLGFRMIRDKYQLNVGGMLQPQKTKFVQDFQGVKVDTTRTVFNVTPTFEYRYNPNDLTRLEITYRGNTSQPSMSDLLDITDDSYPMRITKGNPGLKPSFSNNLRLNYNTYIREHMRTIMTFVNMNTTKNSISNMVTYDERTGKQISRPENINGNWGINSGFMFNTALDSAGIWNINTFTMYNFNNNVGYVLVNNDTKKSTTQSNTIMERLQGSWRKGWFEIALDGSINYTHSRNELQKQSNLDTKMFSYGGSFNVYFPFGMSVTTDLHNQSRRGYNDNSMNTDELVWNAQVSQSFLKGKALTVSVQFYDILQQLSTYSRSVTAMQRSDTQYNTINSYVMLHIIYRLNLFGGKDARNQGGPGGFGPGGGYPGGGFGPGGRPGGGYPGGGRPGGGFGGRP
ncbi:MAG: TonB-dependent receptor [Bacteroidales bacterium]|nr:TonB-dependent receptor [Bacteroidales bacterium]